MAIELVAYSELKALLDLNEAAIADYPALDLLRDSVTSAIEDYLGRDLEVIERTESIFIGSKTKMIMLPAVPISTIASVTVTVAGEDTTYTENTDYEITQYGIRLLSAISNSKIVIVYTGGLSAVPSGIARAALLQVTYEFQAKEHIGAESVSTEGGNVTRPELGLLKEVKRMLTKHQHAMRL